MGGVNEAIHIKFVGHDGVGKRHAFSVSQDFLAAQLGLPGAKVVEIKLEDMGHKIGIRVLFPDDHPVTRGEVTAAEWYAKASAWMI